MSEADTPAKLALIEDAENQEEAISDSDHYIRGQYGVSEKLLPVFTEPNADCDGIAEFQNSGGSDKTVTWNTGTGIGATTQTATTDSNGIFVFESNRSQNFSIPNGNPENHVKYQKGGSTISLTIEGETYTTQVATTPTYAPQVYDLQAVNVVNSVIKFKTSMAADEILINGENSAEQYVALQTLTKAGNSKDGAGKEWTFDMGSYNQNHPSDPISAGDGIEFWVKGNDQGIVAESTRLTYQYHDYLAESVGYRLIAADNALPTLVDTVEKMTFGKLQRGKDGLFNRSPLDLSLDYGHLTVGDATVYKKTPWSIQASLIEQGSFGEDELRIEFVNSLQEHAYLTNSGDAVNVMSAPNGNNGDETVEVDSNWNKTDNGEGTIINQETNGIVAEEGVGFTHLPVLNFGQINGAALENSDIMENSGGVYKIWPIANLQQIGDQSVWTRPYLQIVDQRSDKNDSPLSVSVKMTQPFQGHYMADGVEQTDIQPNLLVKTVALFDYTISGMTNINGHFIQNWGGELGAGPSWTFGTESVSMPSGTSADSFGTLTYEYGFLNNQHTISNGASGNLAGSATYSANERIKNGIYLEMPSNIALKASSYQAEYTWSIDDVPVSD
ncbi:hypothetical protein Pfo_030952 [Paulownia fortunei]|nr:hypothetical protein Pfo_030952 [Paulownia fortunei]